MVTKLPYSSIRTYSGLWTTLLSLFVSCCRLSTGWGLASSAKVNASCEALNLDVAKVRETISAGHVYHHQNFLSESEVQLLLDDIAELESKGMFQRSGLSNTVKGSNQGFGNRDRILCAVPWWQDSLSKAQIRDASSSIGGVEAVSFKLQGVRLALADILARPTIRDAALAHECYYSKSDVGSFLPRHMDERHEELKGSKGWLLPSRRSISWLVYLSDEGWDLETNGGALRSFPQQQIAHGQKTGSHDGNLQVGWLIPSNDGSIPVYLDSWYPVSTSTNDSEPHCILYAVDGEDRMYLTHPWTNDVLVGISVADFINACADRDANGKGSKTKQLFLSAEHASSFSLLEDRSVWDVGHRPEGSAHKDVSPLRASLVMFDSVMVPHEVRTIKKGTRVALAGWFHEETQPFPTDLYV